MQSRYDLYAWLPFLGFCASRGGLVHSEIIGLVMAVHGYFLASLASLASLAVTAGIVGKRELRRLAVRKKKLDYDCFNVLARTDSNTANNAALNLTRINGPNGELAVEIRFEPISGGDGDLTLDGAEDVNTVVFINNVQYTFSFELSGTLPASNRSVPDQFEPVPPDAGSVV